MRKGFIRMVSVALAFLFLVRPSAFADFAFSEERFQGDFSTANLDRIIREYELFDGWYWTTEANVSQDFHGRENCPGWTKTTESLGYRRYLDGWYGCRWSVDRLLPTSPGRGGYGECFGFAQFIGYLLSGDVNPQHHWPFFYSVKSAKGLKVGDIIRTEYTWKGKPVSHSAVVYAIVDGRLLFLQVSGSQYNRISIGSFSDGHLKDIRMEEDVAKLPYLKISRSKLNQPVAKDISAKK